MDSINSNSWTSGWILPGRYTITEDAKTGWILKDISILNDDGDSVKDVSGRTAYIKLDHDENVEVTFKNRTPRGYIQVEVITWFASNPDGFEITPSFDDPFTLNNGDPYWVSDPLPPGTYTLVEALPDGWYIVNTWDDDSSPGTTCDTSTGTYTVDLSDGETVTISYRNSKMGKINVYLDSLPNDLEDFSFSITKYDEFGNVVGLSTFTLDDDEGVEGMDSTYSNSWNSGWLTPGWYKIIENPKDTWELTSINSNDPRAWTESNLLYTYVDYGVETTVTFQNTKISSTNNDPLANIGGPYSGNEGTPINFDASGSSDSDGTIVLYEWDWDNDGTYDETSTTSATTSHTWSDDGSYPIVLRVTDDDDATDTDTITVTVEDLNPTAEFSDNGPQNEGSTVSFTDVSTSSPDNIVSWSWDFAGMGTSNEQNPSFTFTDNGVYTVTLTVTDDDGSFDSVSHDVTISDLGPTAAYDWSPEPQDEGSAVSFTDSSTSSPDSIVLWSWSFGGLGTSTSQNPSFTFMDNGAYTVRLTVTDDDSSADYVEHTVNVNNVAPTVDAGIDAIIDEGDTFTGSGSFTDPGDDSWSATVDYGEGAGPQALSLTGKTFSLSNVYEQDGSYTVTVEVYDGDAYTSDTLIVTVRPYLTVNTNPVEVGGTTGSGSYTPGEVVEITAQEYVTLADCSMYYFTGWTGTGIADTSHPSTTLTMGSSSLTVTANYEELYSVTFTEVGLPTGSNWSVTFNGETLSSTTNTITFSPVIPGTGYAYSVTTISVSDNEKYVPKPSAGLLDVSEDITQSTTYYHQYLIPTSYSTSDDTTPTDTPTLTYIQTGVQRQSPLTTSIEYIWMDAGTGWSIDDTIRPSYTEWYISPPLASDIVDVSTTIDPLYYHQYRIDANSYNDDLGYLEDYPYNILVGCILFQYDFTHQGTTYTNSPGWTGEGSFSGYSKILWHIWVDAGTTLTIHDVQNYYPNDWYFKDTRYRYDNTYPEPITINSGKTLTFNYLTQYRLTVQTSGLPSPIRTNIYLGGSSTSEGAYLEAYPFFTFYDKNTYSETIGVDNVAGDYLFSGWTDSTTANPHEGVYMSEPKSVTANYIKGCKVTFTESGLPDGTSWSVKLGDSTETSTGDSIEFLVAPGSHIYQISDIPLSDSERYWTQTYTDTLHLDGDITVNIPFYHQYKIMAMTHNDDLESNIQPISFYYQTTSCGTVTESIGYAGYRNPENPIPRNLWSTWADSDSTFTLTDVKEYYPDEDCESGVRYRYSNNYPEPILIDSPKELVFNYITQYKLTAYIDPITLEPDYTLFSPSGYSVDVGDDYVSCWYDDSTEVTLTADELQLYGSEAWLFNHWEVDTIDSNIGLNPITVTMNMAHRAVANYRELPASEVTTGELLYLDIEEGIDGKQFRLLFTQDPESPDTFKLTASNPGQFSYNVFYVPHGETYSLSLTIPDGFVTQGASPIQAYSDVGINPDGSYEPIDLLDDYTVKGEYTVSGETPESGFVYVTVHLDYEWKKTLGYVTEYRYVDPIEFWDAANPDRTILDLDEYEFRVTDLDSFSGSDKIQNVNIFKKIPGFGGLVYDGDSPIEGLTVTINLDGTLLGTATTDDNGFYYYYYKHTSKPTKYEVIAGGYGTVTGTIKANKFIEANFGLD